MCNLKILHDMKRIIRIMGLCALVAIAATACKKEAQTTSTLKATLTQPTSNAKTGINNNLNLVWNEGDQIKVFDNNGEEYIFTTNDNGTTTATFTGTELDASASYVAFYPAENASIDGNIIKLGINANQTYAPNSFAAGTYPMVAKSEAGNLAFTFTSDCGLLAIPVKGSGSIGSIELTGKADEDLAGQLQYTIGGDFNYYDGSSKKVTLNCGGVGLGTDPKVFYFVLPSGVLHSGFTAVLKDIMGGELGTLSTDNNNTIEDQTVRMMPAVTVGQTGMVITVNSTQTSASATPNGCTLYGTVTYDPGVVLDEVGFYYGTAAKGLNELPANLTNKVTLENVPASGASFSYTLTGLAENTAYQYCVYVKTGDQEIYGGLESFSTPAFDPYTTPLTFEALSDGVTVELNTLDSYGSFALEYSKNGGDWTSLTNAVTLNTGETVSFRGNNQAVFGNKFTCSGPCYIYGNVMSLLHAGDYATNYTFSEESAFTGLFYNNSNINIPTNKDLVLPATTLANYCYYEMFRGCTGLTRTPELPATTMRFSCYFGMFRGCTGLTTVPADLLPTTTMTNASAGCYQEMFYGCENLTAAPNLPATTLAMDCYRSMFYGCKSLTTAPELPATNLTPSCYYEMFYGCENLTTAPALPAETLENQCYYSMFRDCKSLTTAPTLPAPALVNRCYYSMFRDCIQLNSVTCLATSGINQYYSTANWLYGAASSGTFTKAAGASVETDNTSWQRDTNGIPIGWTVETDYKFSVSATQAVHFAPGNLLNTGDFADNQYDYGNLLYWAASFTTNYSGDWRALTSDEWNYLLTDRANASNLWGFANVVDSNSNGIILLPDGSSLSINTDHSAWDNNSIDNTTWSEMEANGAVFLPAAGYLDGGSPEDNGKKGYYWCSTSGGYMSFGKSGSSFEVPTCYVGGGGRRSVRLVINVQ